MYGRYSVQLVRTNRSLADVLTLHFHYLEVDTLPFPSDIPEKPAEAAAVAAAHRHTDHLDTTRPALPSKEDSAAPDPRSVDRTPATLQMTAEKRTAAVRRGLLAGRGRTLISGAAAGRVDAVERVGEWAWMCRWRGLRVRLC